MKMYSSDLEVCKLWQSILEHMKKNHKVHIGQHFDNFSAFENASVHYQNADRIKFSLLETDQCQTFNADIRYCKFIYTRIHGGRN